MKSFTLFAVAVIATVTSAASAEDGYFRARSASSEYRLPAASASYLRFQAGPQKYEDFPAAAYPAGFSSYKGLGYQGTCCEAPPVYAQKVWAGYCEPDCARPGLLQRLAECLRQHCCKRHEACGYQKGCSQCASCVPADPCRAGHPHGGLLAGRFHCRRAQAAAAPAGPWGHGGTTYYGGGYGLNGGYYEGGGEYEYQPTPASPELPAAPEVPAAPEIAPNDPLPPPPPPAADQSTQFERLPGSLRLDRSANRPARSRFSTFPQSFE